MIGMVQFIGYFLTLYLVYRGLTGFLTAMAETSRLTSTWAKVMYGITAAGGLFLALIAVLLMFGMDSFATGIGK